MLLVGRSAGEPRGRSRVPTSIVEEVRAAAGRRLLLLPHAIRQMARPSPMITTTEVGAVVTGGELVEDYPEDVRGRGCLLLGFGEQGRPIHVVCAPKTEYLAIITAYLPDPADWSPDFRRRLG